MTDSHFYSHDTDSFTMVTDSINDLEIQISTVEILKTEYCGDAVYTIELSEPSYLNAENPEDYVRFDNDVNPNMMYVNTVDLPT